MLSPWISMVPRPAEAKLVSPFFSLPCASATAACTVRRPRSSVFQRITLSVTPAFT